MGMTYPSKWQNSKTNATWILESKQNVEGYPGVLATVAGNQKCKGVINWEDKGGKLLLHTIYAVPRRCGLGSLLMYAFASHAKRIGRAELEILNANPHEHGFYKYTGWQYHAGTLDEMFTGPDHVRWGEIVEVPGDDGKPTEILRAHLNCALVGGMQPVKDKSKASLGRTWKLLTDA